MNSNYRVKMLVELKELKDKIERLDKFLDNPPTNLNQEKRQMMENQLHHMVAYGYALDQRITYEREEFLRQKTTTK
jgi:hypothetical protein